MHKKITIFVFVLSLALFFALTVLVPADANASVKENRPLAEMPTLSLASWFSGSFGEDFEEYLSDNVGFRSLFTTIGARLEKLRGFVPEAKGQLVTLPSGGQLALDGGRIMEVFKANPAAGDSYAATLNRIAATLPDSTNMYLALVPTSIEFTDSPYGSLSDSEKDTIDAIYNALADITPVHVYARLAENKDSYVYFFRTDHHWTQRGAYLGYEALMDAMGEEAIPLEDMTKDKQSGFLGYLYNRQTYPPTSNLPTTLSISCPVKTTPSTHRPVKTKQLCITRRRSTLFPRRERCPLTRCLWAATIPLHGSTRTPKTANAL